MRLIYFKLVPFCLTVLVTFLKRMPLHNYLVVIRQFLIYNLLLVQVQLATQLATSHPHTDNDMGAFVCNNILSSI